MYNNMKTKVSSPTKGDIIFFTWSGQTEMGHVGIVETVSGNTITTIEGNTSNQVARRKYTIGQYKMKYCRPPYEGPVQRDLVLKIAAAEIGVKANPVNCVKYNKWYYNSDTRVPWCAVFVCWVFDQTGSKYKITQTPGTAKNSKGLYYQAHVQKAGWLGKVRDGQTAGTIGYGKRLEALRFTTIPSGVNLDVEVHVQQKGWLKYKKVKANQILGTTNESLRVEAIKIKAYNASGTTVNVSYQAHVQKKGWMTAVKNGAIAGTTGESLRMEAVRIWLP